MYSRLRLQNLEFWSSILKVVYLRRLTPGSRDVSEARDYYELIVVSLCNLTVDAPVKFWSEISLGPKKKE